MWHNFQVTLDLRDGLAKPAETCHIFIKFKIQIIISVNGRIHDNSEDLFFNSGTPREIRHFHATCTYYHCSHYSIDFEKNNKALKLKSFNQISFHI